MNNFKVTKKPLKNILELEALIAHKWYPANTRLTAHFVCGLVSALVISGLKEYDVLYDGCL